MSLDRSLRQKNALIRHRNVLSRDERLTVLKEQEKWEEGRSMFALPKVAHRKVATKKAPKAAPTAGEAAVAAAEGVAAPAEGAAAAGAAAGKGAAPAAKGAKSAAPAVSAGKAGAAPAAKKEDKPKGGKK